MNCGRNRRNTLCGFKRGSSWLRLLILQMASEGKVTGKSVMDRLNETSMGFWQPSPGSVYPALKDLVEAGYLKLEETDGNKAYTITKEGEVLLKDSRFPWTSRQPGATPMADSCGCRTETANDFEEASDSASTSVEDSLSDIETQLGYIKDRYGELSKENVSMKRLKALYEELSDLIKRDDNPS